MGWNFFTWIWTLVRVAGRKSSYTPDIRNAGPFSLASLVRVELNIKTSEVISTFAVLEEKGVEVEGGKE